MNFRYSMYAVYEFSLLNVCSDGLISSMKHERFWLLQLFLGGL